MVLTFDDGYDDMYRLAYPVLVEQRLPFVLYLTTHPTETGEALFSGADPCTWQQVEAMAASGLMTLGAHTHRHNDLREVTVDQATDDLGTSNEIIQARMGVSAQHFCYPYGFWSETAHGPVASMYHTAVLGSGPPIGADTDSAPDSASARAALGRNGVVQTKDALRPPARGPHPTPLQGVYGSLTTGAGSPASPARLRPPSMPRARGQWPG